MKPNAVILTQFIKNGGSASEFLKADGSVDNTIYSSSVVIGANSWIKLGTWYTTQSGCKIEFKIFFLYIYKKILIYYYFFIFFCSTLDIFSESLFSTISLIFS